MHYFKNKELVEVLVKWQKEVNNTPPGKTPPDMPPVLCHAAIQYANKLCSRFNFRDYTWRDIMEGEIIETIWKRTLNFDITKSSNLFSYWFKIGHNAAVQVIKKEKREQNKKIQMLREMDIESLIDDETADPETIQEFIDYIRAYSDDKEVKTYDKPKEVKLKKVKPSPFDKILEGI